MLQSLRIVAFVLLICIGAVAQLFGDPVNLGMVQSYSFPLLLFLIGTSSAVRCLSPFFRMGFIGVLGLLFVGLLTFRFVISYQSSRVPAQGATFEVAILAGDSFGGLTRAISEEILRRSPIPLIIRTQNTRILDASLARSFLSAHGDVKVLIWGSRELLVLERQMIRPSPVGEGVYSVAPLNQLTLIREVPRLLLPVDSAFHSFLYLARLLSGIASNDSDEISALFRIRSAAFLRGLWPSQSHIAYAFWQSGTRLLELGLRSETGGLAYIECALASFRVAWRILAIRDNHYLAAAILNNHGVALAAKGVLEVAPAQLRIASGTLRRGKKIAKAMKFESSHLNAEEDRLFVGDALSRNLRILGDYGIWNELPSAKKVLKVSKRRDQKKGDTENG